MRNKSIPPVTQMATSPLATQVPSVRTSSGAAANRESDKRLKRQRLLSESLRLFREKGYEDTTVAEITQAAGVAKGTFFNYFPTKEDVLLALGEQTLGRLQQVDASELFGTGSTQRKVSVLFQSLAAGLDADRDLVRQMVYRGLRLPDLVNRERSRLDFRSTLMLLLNQGKRRGEVGDGVDVAFVADTLYTLYFQQVVSWCSSDFTGSIEDRLDQVIALVFDGIKK